MKAAARYPHFDQTPLSVFLAEAMVWLIEALDFIGAGEKVRDALLSIAASVRAVLFARAVLAADPRPSRPHLPRLFHQHTHLTRRAIIRAMLGAHLRQLTRGGDRARIEALLHAIKNADAIVAKIKARILRRAGRFTLRRLVYNPPRTRDFAGARIMPPALAADTS